MTWLNDDGLYVKFGLEEASKARGGDVRTVDGTYKLQFIVDYTDVLSATEVLYDNRTSTQSGTLGVLVPKGMHIRGVEFEVVDAFTSSGTIGTSTFVMGLIKASDRSTALDADGFTTTSFTGGSLDVDGERTYLDGAATGNGALIGTEITEDGLVCLANSQHVSHPFNGGRVRVTIHGTYNILN